MSAHLIFHTFEKWICLTLCLMILIYLIFSAHPIDLKILCGMNPFTAAQSTKMNLLATDTYFFIAKKNIQ